jgi:hypothetical protein
VLGLGADVEITQSIVQGKQREQLAAKQEIELLRKEKIYRLWKCL